MKKINEKLSSVAWEKVTEEMNAKGYAIIPDVVSNEQCEQLVKNYSSADQYRKTITMERYRFGSGEYKYFKYPLPGLIQSLREEAYSHLAPIANEWMKMLAMDNRFPDKFSELQSLCHEKNQIHPTVLILKYNKGGYNTLHQDLYGEVFFPIQAVLFLNEADEDYTGGEFVLLQQNPRAQSMAIVLRPPKGSMLIFTTSFRPVKGNKSYYRVNVKHGVSELYEGQRHTLGIIFHDALS
jgi:uncharacterized protein